MQDIIRTLSQPKVQAVVAEFFALEASGVATLTTPEGHDGMVGALHSLFSVLRDMLSDEQVLRTAAQFHNAAQDDDDDHDAAAAALPVTVDDITHAEEFCKTVALSHAVVALFLLRRKLRSLGPKAHDEAAVIKEVDGVVALLVPGRGFGRRRGKKMRVCHNHHRVANFSILPMWQENRASCSRLWEALGGIIATMDQHCPDPEHHETGLEE